MPLYPKSLHANKEMGISSSWNYGPLAQVQTLPFFTQNKHQILRAINHVNQQGNVGVQVKENQNSDLIKVHFDVRTT